MGLSTEQLRITLLREEVKKTSGKSMAVKITGHKAKIKLEDALSLTLPLKTAFIKIIELNFLNKAGSIFLIFLRDLIDDSMAQSFVFKASL